MEEFKKFRTACGEEKGVVLFETNKSGKKIELACGRRIFFDEIAEAVFVGEESITAKHKRPGIKGYLAKLVSREKISMGTKRKAKEILIIDREKNLKIHRVWEMTEKGEWVLVHEEEVQLK